MTDLNTALLNDLLQSTNFKKNKVVKNPINIIWMLENSTNISQKAHDYLFNLKLKEDKFNAKSSRTVSHLISNILSNETIFLKRFDFLTQNIESLAPYSLPIIDLKSVNILKHAINLGLDINASVNDNTYLLKYALDTKNNIISNTLFNLPNIDKTKIDTNGNNLAHLACLGKNYHMIAQLSKEQPSLFYIKNNHNINAIDILFNYKQYHSLPKQNQTYVKESILIFLKAHYTNMHNLSDDTINIINNSSTLKNILIESQYNELNDLMPKTNNQTKKTHKI